MSSIEIGSGVDAPSSSWAGRLLARPRLLLFVAIFVAACLGQLTALAKFQAVWSAGTFFDTDDAMRAVQVRDLTAGQGWFDMTAHRLDPPAGVFMHWSRVIDVPLLLLAKGFVVVTDPVTAERLMRLAFPFLLTLALFALVVSLCERLLGQTVRYPALAAAFLFGPATGQFEPGRIDHHAPQIVLLMLAVWGLSHGFMGKRAQTAGIAGAALSLSMAISVENVPFFYALIAALVAIWALDGARVSSVLTWFSIGVTVALPFVYALTIAPSRWSLVAADALSLAQAAGLVTAAALLLAFAIAARHLPDDARIRAVVAVVGAAASGALLLSQFPVLAENPFARLDPAVRAWLNGVEEAQPLLRKLAADPLWTIGIVAPALIGLGNLAWQALRVSSRQSRAAWLLAATTAAGGLAASMAMVRTLSPVLALGVPGSLALALALREHLSHRHAALRGPFATLVLVLSTSSVGWAAMCSQLSRIASVPSGVMRQETIARVADFGVCTTPDAFAQLARLPTGLVLAEPDLGGYILANTHHSVLAGAYHRDSQGIRETADAFLADPETAPSRVAETRAKYVVFCRAAADLHYLRDKSDALAARLAKGDAPTWLRHLAAEASPLDIYLTP